LVPRFRYEFLKDRKISVLSLGAFEKEENIQLFVNYAIKAFEAFGNRARLWATFNEPTVYMFCSYLAGIHAPGKSFKYFKPTPSSNPLSRFSLAGQVLLNMLKAHCEVSIELIV